MKVLSAVLILSTFLTGCVQKEIVDDVNLETGAAYDYIGGKIRGTALVPNYLSNKSVSNQTFSSSSNLSRDFIRDVQRQSSDPLVAGSLKVVLFGERLANEKGILDLIDSFQRDPSIGARLYLAVTEGDSKSVINGNYGERGNAIYLSHLIRHNMQSKDVPKTDLQRFLFDFNQKGKTPYLPRLKKWGKEDIEISGLSFFRYGHVVDTISADKMFYFKLLVDKYSKGTLKVNLGKDAAAIESIRSNYKMRLSSRKPYKVTVNINVKAILNEYSGLRITPQKLKKIEGNLEKNIESECVRLTKRFQAKNLDPVGFGHFIKSKTRHFDFNKWEANYKDLQVTVHANVTITESGVID